MVTTGNALCETCVLKLIGRTARVLLPLHTPSAEIVDFVDFVVDLLPSFIKVLFFQSTIPIRARILAF